MLKSDWTVCSAQSNARVYSFYPIPQGSPNSSLSRQEPGTVHASEQPTTLAPSTSCTPGFFCICRQPPVRAQAVPLGPRSGLGQASGHASARLDGISASRPSWWQQLLPESCHMNRKRMSDSAQSSLFGRWYTHDKPTTVGVGRSSSFKAAEAKPKPNATSSSLTPLSANVLTTSSLA